MRERWHAALPIRQHSADRGGVEARYARRDERYTIVCTQPIRAVTSLTMLLINNLPWRNRRRAATAAADVLAGTQQSEDARIVVSDDVDGARSRLTGCAAE